MKSFGSKDRGLKQVLKDTSNRGSRFISPKNSDINSRTVTSPREDTNRTFGDSTAGNTYYMGAAPSRAKLERSLNSMNEENLRKADRILYSQGSIEAKSTLETALTEPTARNPNIIGTTLKKRPYVDPDSLESMFLSKTLSTFPSMKHLTINTNIDEYDLRPTLTTTHTSLAKFTKTIHVLNTCEKRKLPLSRDIFFTKEQVETIKNFNKEFSQKPSKENYQVRILRENKKEVVELLPSKKTFFKIECTHKNFPLQVKTNVISGSFEAFVSLNYSTPDSDTYDLYFNTENFSIKYEKEIDMLYLGITASERLKMTLTINFTNEEEEKKKKDYAASLREWQNKKEKDKKKKNPIYEFFHDEMTIDEKLDLKERVNEIKREKREKLLFLSGNKNIIKQNAEIAKDYHTIKEAYLHHLKDAKMHQIERTKQHKEIIDQDKKMKQLYNSVKREIVYFEREWRKDEEKKAMEKLRFELSWATTLTVFTLCKEIIEKKRTMTAWRILSSIKMLNASKIQRRVRMVLYKPLIHLTAHGAIREVSSLKFKMTVTLYEALNSSALTIRKMKVKKAETTLGRLFMDMVAPSAIMTKMDQHMAKIKKLQRRWKHHMEIYKSRVKIFLYCWHQYCLSIIDDETKKKKKKYSDEIAKMKEHMVIRHAKIFVQNKKKAALKAARFMMEDAEERRTTGRPHLKASATKPEESAKKSATFITTTEPIVKEKIGSRTTTPGKGVNPRLKLDLSKASAEEEKKDNPNEKVEAKKSKAKFYPTKEEMKEVFDKILEEVLKAQESPR